MKILTYEEAYKEQSNLDELCKDRHLRTNEIFAPNAFYGINYIIKTYSNYPLELPLKAVFPHGVSFDNYIWEEEINCNVPIIFYYGPHKERLYRERTNKKLIRRTASPFIYVKQLLKFENNIKREGTIFFPAHSTHHIETNQDYQILADELYKFDEIYKPITVCMYWADYIKGYHQPFLDKGFQVFSAGHMYDNNFLLRLYYLCSAHCYAASNVVGTHLFYAVKAGCSYFHHKSESNIDRKGKGLRDFTNFNKESLKFIDLFGEKQSEMTTKQKKLVDDYLGADYYKTPDELRTMLVDAEKYDKNFVLIDNDCKRILYIPYFYRRKINKLKQWIKRIIKFITQY